MTSRCRRRLAAAAVAPGLVVLAAGAASAHPLGNFTINAYSGLVVQSHQLAVDYVVDMAEIPAYQERAAVTAEGPSGYASMTCLRYAGGLRAIAGGQALHLTLDQSSVRFPPGAAGLSTLRLECAFVAVIGDARSLTWADVNFAGHVGWHEVTATGDRVTVTSSTVPRTSVSRRLTDYPRDLLRSPLSQRTASVSWRPGGPAYVASADSAAPSAAVPLAPDTSSRWYARLLSRHSPSAAFALFAVLASIALGSVHALSPGHGKTVMAAYLVGNRGSVRDAIRLGLTVAATHTAGVLCLALGISTATTWAPDRLYPWLTAASGLLIFATGATLLRSQLRRKAHDHDHAHDHAHDHGHPHEHPHPHAPSRRGIMALGFAGGLVPSPAAVLVLLGAFALHRVWLGVVLVLAYGVGMAGMLVTVGLVVARLAKRARRLPTPRLPASLRRPASAAAVSSFAVMAAGLVVIGRSAISL